MELEGTGNPIQLSLLNVHHTQGILLSIIGGLKTCKMITTIKLINISITSHGCNFFLVVRTLKIYSLSKFDYTIQYYEV